MTNPPLDQCLQCGRIEKDHGTRTRNGAPWEGKQNYSNSRAHGLHGFMSQRNLPPEQRIPPQAPEYNDEAYNAAVKGLATQLVAMVRADRDEGDSLQDDKDQALDYAVTAGQDVQEEVFRQLTTEREG